MTPLHILFALVCTVGALPDTRCTPGDTIVGLTAKQVCVPGYATEARKQLTSKTKTAAWKLYNIPKSSHTAYTLDHVVALELAGSNSIKNLFPQPRAEAKRKDLAENAA